MELNNKTVEELEARKAEIASEIDTLEKVEDVEARSAEVETINKELETRKALEAEKAELRKAAAELGEQTKSMNNEEKKMENEKRFSVESVEYRDAWVHALQRRELTIEERSGYDQSGANAIPTQVANKFFEKMKKLAPMLNEITLMHVAGNLKFVGQGTRNAATKHTENAALSVQADTTVAVTLGAKEFFKIIAISESARQMVVEEFINWLVEMLAGDIARALDDYIINDSSNGIVKAGTWTSGTNCIIATTPGYGDILSLIALLPAAYDAEAKFLTNKYTLYNKIASIVNSAGDPIFVAKPEEGMVGRIMGYPVLLDDYVETTKSSLYLGAWRNVVGNLSKDVEVISYPDYDYGQIKFRGGAFFDSKVANAEAIVRLTTTA